MALIRRRPSRDDQGLFVGHGRTSRAVDQTLSSFQAEVDGWSSSTSPRQAAVDQVGLERNEG